MDKGHVRDTRQETNQMMEGSEKQTSQKSMDNSETTLKKISVKVGTEITNACGVESGGNVEKGLDKETPTPSEKESERRREVFSKTISEEIKNVESETLKVIKEEKIEEPLVKKPLTKPIGETLESCQNTDKANRTEVEEERSKSSNDLLKQLKNDTYHENKRKSPSSMSDKSQEDTCPNEDEEKEIDHKRQWLPSKQDSSCEEPQNLRSIEQKEVTPAEEGEGGKPSHKTVKDKGV